LPWFRRHAPAPSLPSGPAAGAAARRSPNAPAVTR
jgi:hypothetical protein